MGIFDFLKDRILMKESRHIKIQKMQSFLM